jgi:hypothetical protein
LHVVGLSAKGGPSNLWHTLRSPAGTWQPAFGLVRDPGRTRQLDAVACAAVGADLHVLALEQGDLVHTVRGSGGWQPAFGHPPTPAGSPVTAVSAAGIGATLHVVLVVGGRLWHTTRDAKGWHPTGFLAVPAAAGELTAVGCAGVNGALHVVALGTGGTASNLWHTVRRDDQTWQKSAGNVKDPGQVRRADDVTCAGVGADLHLVLRTGTELWHTVRSGAGRWQSAFGRVRALGYPGAAPFAGLAAAGVR